MGDFTADIRAKLDLGEAKSQLDSFLNQTRNVKVKVDLETGNVNIASFLNQLQSQFKQAGQQVGQSFTQSVNSSFSKINVRNAASQISDMQRTLKSMHVDSSAIDTITKNLTSMNIAIKKVTTDIDSNTGNLKIKIDGIDESVSGIQRMVSITKEFDSSSGIMARSGEKIVQTFDDIGKVTAKASEWQSKLNSFKEQFRDILSINGGNNSLANMLKGIDFSNITSSTGLDDMVQKFKQVQEEGQRLNSMFNKTWASNAIENFNARLERIPTELSIIESKFKNLGDASFKTVQGDIERVRQGLRDIGKETDVEKKIQKFNELDNTLKKINLSYRQSAAAQRSITLDQDVSITSNKLESWMQRNTIAASKYKDKIEEIRVALKNVSSAGDLKAVQKDINELQAKAGAEGNLGKGIFATLKSNIGKVSPLFGMGSLVATATRALKSMYDNVVQIDTAMTELRKVTDETASTYERFQSNAGKTAQEIGTTVSDFITSTADFARLGYDFDQAQNMAKIANIYKVVGDDIADISTATQSVISTQKAFNISTEESMSIVDRFNEVSNNFAISSGGIGEAMTRSASSLAAAGNTIDQSIALITAANTVVNTLN